MGNSGKAMLSFALLLITQMMSCGLAAQESSLPDKRTADDGCALAPVKPGPERDKFFQEWIGRYGGAEFRNPPEVRPTSAGTRYTLEVRYGDNVIAGCAVHLRSYNGMPVGPTIRAKPGDTLYLTLVNHLPEREDPHPQNPPPSGHGQHFSFNITNLHTHGLHTAPQGSEQAEGDNVLLEIPPGSTQKYEIHIPENHPSGTFWYHAHVHGATAIQVSSGMAGALLIEGGHHDHGGLDSVPQIAKAQERIFVLQQFNYGPDGRIENFTQPGDRNWLSRGVMVNGQLVPTIKMRPGEIQRWRLVHAGVEDNIHLSLDEHELYEIADDGITLGRSVKWPAAEPIDGVRNPIVGPGYRLDVLVQAKPLRPGETRHEYFLRDLPLGPGKSLTAASAAIRLATRKEISSATEVLNEILEKPEFIIARVIVEGEPTAAVLPSDVELQKHVPSALTPITDSEIRRNPYGTEQVKFTIDFRVCAPDGTCSPNSCDSEVNCALRFMINDKVYMSGDAGFRLKLGTASEWVVQGNLMPHPFHIHVNPFQVERLEPGPDGKPRKMTVWKDTFLLPPDDTTVTLRSRYTDFRGKFVLHCHILEHEDQGMMENVEIY